MIFVQKKLMKLQKIKIQKKNNSNKKKKEYNLEDKKILNIYIIGFKLQRTIYFLSTKYTYAEY